MRREDDAKRGITFVIFVYFVDKILEIAIRQNARQLALAASHVTVKP
jgi:hypothetical protein